MPLKCSLELNERRHLQSDRLHLKYLFTFARAIFTTPSCTYMPNLISRRVHVCLYTYLHLTPNSVGVNNAHNCTRTRVYHPLCV
jgi:hypothetical protein